MSRDAKKFKELDVIGFVCCFSAEFSKVQKTYKYYQNSQKNTVFWHLVRAYQLLAEKQQNKSVE